MGIKSRVVNLVLIIYHQLDMLLVVFFLLLGNGV